MTLRALLVEFIRAIMLPAKGVQGKHTSILRSLERCRVPEVCRALSGLASGLALAVRPRWVGSPGSRVGACAHRLGDATEGSALDAGGPTRTMRGIPSPCP